MSAAITDLPVIRGTADGIHAGLLAQLDAVRAFIAAHPSFPVTAADVHAGGFAVIRKFCGTPSEVDRIAAGIGITGRWQSATQYVARLKCGPVVDYEVICIVQPEAEDQDPRGSVREMAEAV